MSRRISQHCLNPMLPLRRWLGLALLILLTLSGATRAATLTVTSTADPGVANDNQCTLREALAAIDAGANDANDCLNGSGNGYGVNDTILFAGALANGTITVTLAGGGAFGTGKAVTITGPVVNDPNGITLNGNNALPVFIASQPVTLQHLTITQGTTNSLGGAGFRTSSNVTLNYCTVSNNSSSIGLGGVAGFGGGIFANGNIALNHSTVSGNSAGNGGVGGGLYALGSITLDSSTVSGNTATNAGGGVGGDGPITSINSTVSGNTATGGGGGIYATDNVTLINSTVTNNTATTGGGVVVSTNQVGGGNFTVTLNNSILSDNSSIINDPDLYREITSGSITVNASHSLLGTGVQAQLSGNINNLFTDTPQFDPLANNGGPTQTHALLAVSPALDAADNAICANAPVSGLDQRGVARGYNAAGAVNAPRTGDCDIGAFELPVDTLIIVKQTLPDGSPQTFDFSLDGGALNSPITDGGQLILNPAPGQHSLNETVPDGWDLTAIVCDDQSVQTNPAARPNLNFTLTGAGVTITCTFTNTQRGAVVIDKQTVPGGSAASFSFSSMDLGQFQLTDGAAPQSFGNLAPGQYTVSELALAGWDLTAITCNDGGSATPSSGNLQNRTVTLNVDPGETVTCTFTNTQRGTVIIEKQTLPDGSPTTFTFSGAVNGNIGDSQQLSAILPSGNYTVSETVPADWDLTAIVCDDANSGILQGATASINLEVGETVTCTFTNTQRATLVIGLDAPGSAPTAFDFTTVGLAPAAFALQDGQTQPFTGLLPGQSYVVDDQPPPPGWVFDEVLCSAPPPVCVPGSVTVTPLPGQAVTATFRFLRLSSGAESIPAFTPWGLGVLIGVLGLLLARLRRR